MSIFLLSSHSAFCHSERSEEPRSSESVTHIFSRARHEAFERSLACARDDKLKKPFGKCSSHSTEKSSENSADAAPRPVDLHRLRVFEQTDRGRELWVFSGRC